MGILHLLKEAMPNPHPTGCHPISEQWLPCAQPTAAAVCRIHFQTQPQLLLSQKVPLLMAMVARAKKSRILFPPLSDVLAVSVLSGAQKSLKNDVASCSAATNQTETIPNVCVEIYPYILIFLFESQDFCNRQLEKKKS